MNGFIQGKVIEIFKSMSIDISQLPPSFCLGIEIGMDSQEIVEFTCAVEATFNIAIKPFTFHKKTLISEVMNKITQALQETSSTSSSEASYFLKNFSGFCEKEIIINKERQEVFNAIYEFEQWPIKLKHVKKISTLYNDGKFQEFLMQVQSSEADVIDVRSIRKCDNKQFTIRFFQPQPPTYLHHHCGGWSFQELSPFSCLVKTWHQWNINEPIAKEKFQSQELDFCQKIIENTLASHAELALSTWKTNLEKI